MLNWNLTIVEYNGTTSYSEIIADIKANNTVIDMTAPDLSPNSERLKFSDIVPTMILSVRLSFLFLKGSLVPIRKLHWHKTFSPYSWCQIATTIAMVTGLRYAKYPITRKLSVFYFAILLALFYTLFQTLLLNNLVSIITTPIHDRESFLQAISGSKLIPLLWKTNATLYQLTQLIGNVEHSIYIDDFQDASAYLRVNKDNFLVCNDKFASLMTAQTSNLIVSPYTIPYVPSFFTSLVRKAIPARFKQDVAKAVNYLRQVGILQYLDRRYLGERHEATPTRTDKDSAPITLTHFVSIVPVMAVGYFAAIGYSIANKLLTK